MNVIEKKIRRDFLFLILSLITVPGIKIHGLMINFCDFYIPYLFFKYLRKNKYRIYKKNNNIIFLCLYVFVSFFSIILACLQTNIVGITNFFKLIRLVYVVFCYYVYSVQSEYLSVVFCNWTITVCGIFSIVEAIVIFLLQSTYFCALGENLQSFYWGGRIVYRAGGIFGEPITFSLVCSLIIVCSLSLLDNKEHVVIGVVGFGFGMVGIAVSGSRTAILSLFVVLICNILFINWEKKLFIIVMCACVSALVFIAYRNSLYLYYFINEKLVTLISAVIQNKSAEYNALSSGRIKNWENVLNIYRKSNWINVFLGHGYKVESILVDNNYISWLWETGIIGFALMFLFWIKNIYRNIKIKTSSRNQRLSVIVLWFCIMIFVDATSVYRFFSISIVLMNYFLIEKRNL